MRGLEGNDLLEGGTGGGADELRGGRGNDLMSGEACPDAMYGDGGIDTMYGLSGDDSLDGGPGVDFLYGQAGADALCGGVTTAADALFGGATRPDRRRHRDVDNRQWPSIRWFTLKTGDPLGFTRVPTTADGPVFGLWCASR